MQKNIEKKQQAMRARVAKRPKKKPCRPRLVHMQWTPGGEFKLRRRIVARFLILKGWSIGQVASHFGVRTEAVMQWKLAGMPTTGDRPVRPLLDAI